MSWVNRLFSSKQQNDWVISGQPHTDPKKEILPVSEILKNIQNNNVEIKKNRKIIIKNERDLNKKNSDKTLVRNSKQKAEGFLREYHAMNKNYFEQLNHVNPKDYNPKQRKIIEKSKKAILEIEKESINDLGEKVENLKASRISRLFGAEKFSPKKSPELLAIAKELEDAKVKVSDQTDSKIVKKIQTLELKLGKALSDLKKLKSATDIQNYLTNTRVIERSFGIEDKVESLYILKYLSQHKLVDEKTKQELRNEIRTMESSKARNELNLKYGA